MYTTLIDAPTLLRERRENWCLLDCRFSLADSAEGARAYAEGHLPGAHYADLERDLSGPATPGATGRHPLPDADALRRWLGGLGVTPDTQVVAYDQVGPFSARAWWLARWLGHDRVAVLDGGIDAWRAMGGPLSEETPHLDPSGPGGSPYPQRAPLARAVDAEDVLAGLGGQLVDAREAARFLGEHEPIDALAGRIPGAINQPFAQNFRAPAQFRPPAELASMYESLLGREAEQPVTCYCGSGVSAAVVVLAMVLAGRPQPALYVGSFSDWIADPQRPVARGPAE